MRSVLALLHAPITACCAAISLAAVGPLVLPGQGGSGTQDRAAAVPEGGQPDHGASGADQVQARYAITPERRALLNTIRFAEGTWKNGRREGYHTLYGGGHFADLSRHPERVVVKRYTSAAAGAYQFLPRTWSEASRRLQLSSFDPASQDQAALYLADRRGVLESIDRGQFNREAMAVLAKEWASFPTLAGASAYGQPVKRAEDLERFYSASLRQAQGRAAA